MSQSSILNIPNFTGPNAGLQFRQALNNALAYLANFFGPQNFYPPGMTDNIAATGNSQSTAYQITTQASFFTSVPSGSGAILPSTVGGIQGGTPLTVGTTLDVWNFGANPLYVYPPSGWVITSLTLQTLPANSPVQIPIGTRMKFVYRGLIGGTYQWYAG
jgi:hypothetical protein